MAYEHSHLDDGRVRIACESAVVHILPSADGTFTIEEEGEKNLYRDYRSALLAARKLVGDPDLEEELLLRWQGRAVLTDVAVCPEVCETSDHRFRIHLPKLERVLIRDGDQIRVELRSWWDHTEPYRNVEDAKREAITLAIHKAFQLHALKFRPEDFTWAAFDERDPVKRRASVI
jgi:hypothetical protein